MGPLALILLLLAAAPRQPAPQQLAAERPAGSNPGQANPGQAIPGQAAPDEAAVGLPSWKRDLVLPGSELVVLPAQRSTPVILRIDAASPHGSAWRYDLVWYGLDPGDYDLGTWLARRDGSSTADLPPLPIRVLSRLPPGRVEPERPLPGRPPRLGGYRLALEVGAVIWGLGLLWILLAGRRRASAEAGERRPPPTLADHLRPLVEAALAGRLAERERSELELSLIAFWRRRLDLEGLSTAEALRQLRAHPEAGPLLRGLEDWLHRPRGPGQAQTGAREPVDVEALLRPYLELPAEALEPARAEASA